MPEIIFSGPSGRLEGRYHHGSTASAPLALILHPLPHYGGTMNNKVVFSMFQSFVRRGFATLRFNFRGVGRSQGRFDNGQGELADAAAALDWMQGINPNAGCCWVAGYSFGAWIGMQLLMRRPEVDGFISVAPPANLYDFSFLAPCPSSGLVIHGTADELVPEPAVSRLVAKLGTQRNISVSYRTVEGSNHSFAGGLEEVSRTLDDYLSLIRLDRGTAPPPAANATAAAVAVG